MVDKGAFAAISQQRASGRQVVTDQATFTAMQNGTAEDWQIIGAAHMEEFKNTADRFIDLLKSLEQHTLGFACNQLHHSPHDGNIGRAGRCIR